MKVNLRAGQGTLALLMLGGIVAAAWAGGSSLRERWIEIGSMPGAAVQQFATDGTNTYAVAVTRVFRSAGGAWTRSGESFPLTPGFAPIESAAVHNGRLFVKMRGVGVMEQAADGAWLSAGVGLNPTATTKLISATSGFYAVTGGGAFSSATLFRRADGGEWSPLTTPVEFSSVMIRDTLILGAIGGGTVVRSTDAGQTWTTISTGSTDFLDLELATPAAIYARGFFSSQRIRSLDGGLTWQPTGAEVVTNLHAIGEDLYGIGADQRPRRSLDRGQTWTVIATGLPTTRTIRQFGSRGANLLAAVGENVFRSADRGATWQDDTAGLAALPVADLETNSGTLLGVIFSDTSVFRSLDDGVTWARRLSASGLTKLHAASPGRWLIGSLRDGVVRTLDDGGSFAPATVGLPSYNGTAGLQFHELNAFVRLDNAIYVSTGGGTQQVGDEHGGGFTLSGAGVYRSLDQGATWAPVRNGPPTGRTDQFGQIIFNPNYGLFTSDNTLFVSTFPRGLYRSTNGGASWQPSATGMHTTIGGVVPNVIAMITIGTRIIALSESSGTTGLPTIYVSANGGAGWTPASAGLPTNRSGAAMLRSGNRIYLALGPSPTPAPSDPAIFVSTDEAATWQPLDATRTPVRITDLVEHEGAIIAATNGDGIWRLVASPLGDVNCDGAVNFDDIEAFVAAVVSPAAYAEQFPACDRALADADESGAVDFDDINSFVALIVGG